MFGEFVFSWARWFYQSFGLSNGFDPTQLGFPSYLASHSISLGFPSVAPGEMSGLGGYYNEYDVSDRYEGKANISSLHGKHTFKFGGMYGMGKYTTRLADNNTGSYSASAAFTQGPNPLVGGPTSGFGYASFLLGTMSGGTHNVTELHGHYSEPYYGVYFQDDYKVTAHLTLNLGIRWEYEAPRVEVTTRFRISTSPERRLYPMEHPCAADWPSLELAACPPAIGIRTRRTSRRAQALLTALEMPWCFAADTASSTATVGGTEETTAPCRRPVLSAPLRSPPAWITDSHPTRSSPIPSRRDSARPPEARPVC
jgi:hypothetical protein